jgi:hypothetical protein
MLSYPGYLQGGCNARAAFFQDLHRTIAAGVVLLIVTVILVGLLSGQFTSLTPDGGGSLYAGCTL